MKNTIETVTIEIAKVLVMIGDSLTLQCPEWDQFVFTKKGYLDLKSRIMVDKSND